MTVAIGAFVVVVGLGQAPCPPDAAALMAEATVLAQEFDLPAAAERLRTADRSGCAAAAVGSLYVGGLVAARDAFRLGGPPEALAPVHAAIAELARIVRDRPGPAEVARLVLQAAAAAAQSERDEMSVYLDAAARMEGLQMAAGRPGAPVLGGLEVAGDLWLQLHRYPEARRAYMAAAGQRGASLRMLAGLARSASRLGARDDACAEYRALIDRWGARQAEPPEIADARAYLRQQGCQSTGTP
jgi:hypothetical protein